MVGETIAPQIDVFKSSIRKGKMIECGVHAIQGKQGVVHQTKNIHGASFAGSYYIYTLEWSPEAHHLEDKRIGSEPSNPKHTPGTHVSDLLYLIVTRAGSLKIACHARH
jgi:hypothetical protein